MESEMISAQKSAIQLQGNSSPSSTSTFTACSWRRLQQIAKMSSCLVSRRIQQRNSAIKIVMCLNKLQRNHALNMLELWICLLKNLELSNYHLATPAPCIGYRSKLKNSDCLRVSKVNGQITYLKKKTNKDRALISKFSNILILPRTKVYCH